MPLYSTNIVTTTPKRDIPSPLHPVSMKEYPGEYVNWTVGGKLSREFIKPKNTFYKENSKAIVFGNGPTRNDIPVSKIVQSNSKKIVNYYNILYSCNAAFKDFTSDFLVVTNKFIANTIPADLQSTVFATPEIHRLFRKTNLIPASPHMDAGASAAYLACAQGATKVFLVGFDGAPSGKSINLYNDTPYYPKSTDQVNDQDWQDNLYRVIAAYPNTMFYRVNTDPPSARLLNKLPNYKVIESRSFVSLADI